MGWCAVFLAAASCAGAFTVEYDVQPRTLELGEAATCTFTIRDLDQAPLPVLKPATGLQISGPSRGSNIRIVNGRMDQSLTFQYQLFPTQTGKITVEPLPYEAGGRTVNLAPVELTVVGQEGAAESSGAATDAGMEMLFARLAVDPATIYNQQVFDITFSIYYRGGINMARDVAPLNLPASGLTLLSFQEVQGTREVVNNQVYEVRRFQGKMQAMTAGSFRLEPVLRAALLVQREQRRRGLFDDPFFDSFMFGGTQAQPVDIRPEPVEINVLPLPAEGRPPDFAGAVGRFAFDVQAKPLEVKVGDPITLNFQISGEGNIESVAAPQLPESDAFKRYESKLVSKEIREGQGVGRKVFEQVIIPKSTDARTLPAVVFSYFDPRQAKYVTVSRGPFDLKVAPSPEGAARLLQGHHEAAPPPPRLLGSDIVYLKPAPRRWIALGRAPRFFSPWAGALLGAPPILLALLWAWVRRRDELQRDVARARRGQAPRSARAALGRADAALSQGQPGAFYEALWEAMASYFSHRLNLAPGGISSDAVLAALQRAGVKAPTADLLRRAFRQCEEARFAAGGGAMTGADRAALEELRQQVQQALKECERIRL